MAVRLTESRLPGDVFDNKAAEKLGQSHVQGNYALISYLGPTLRIGKKGDYVKHIKNTYVVFVNSGAGVPDPISYAWSLKFYEGDASNPFHSHAVERTPDKEGMIYHLDTEEFDLSGNYPEKKLSKLAVSVQIRNSGPTLTLTQLVEDLNSDFENYIISIQTEKDSSASIGDPDLARLLANDYKDILFELDKDRAKNEDLDISIHLVASVLFGELQDRNRVVRKISDWFRDTGEEEWLDYLNKRAEISNSANANLDELVGEKMGVTALKPHIAKFSTDLVSNPNEFILKEADKVRKFEKNVLEKFHQVSIKEKIDFFNQLRFPKSCLKLTQDFLKNLKNRHSSWASTITDKESHLHNRDCITTIISELETVPQKNLDKPTKLAKQTYNIMFSRWMQVILQTSYIQFETVMIKVLDIRSGKPIKNARIKRLTIKSNELEIDTNFETTNEIEGKKHDWKEPKGDTIEKKSQFALWHLGYNPGNPSTGYGSTGRNAYNAFWNARIIDGTFKSLKEGEQPSEIMLKEIIEEYQSHSKTDENGVLNVRVPTNLLEGRRVHIDIGFMEFPIVCEKLADDERTDPILRSENTETATGFEIRWILGNNANGQITDWNNTVNGNGDFGWEASINETKSMLKVALRLKIKTDDERFNGLKAELLSRFYDIDSHPYHFNVFGMQWCQPVWDEFDDSLSITDSTYVQRQDHANLHMHLVTLCRDLRGSEIYGGKGYGKRDHQPSNNNYQPKWRGDNGHAGLDLYGKIGDPVFAIHGGKTKSHEEGFVGKIVDLDWEGAGTILTFTQYMHLSDNEVVESNTFVLSGTIIGMIGRTGTAFTPEPSEWPTHVHLWVTDKNVPGEIVELRNTPDALNQKCIPNNDTSLVFPCKCHVPNPDRDPSDCNFSKAKFIHNPNPLVTRGCWAVAELKCPKMYEKDRNDVFRLQAQLRYLNEKPASAGNPFDEGNHSEYIHPGDVNGDDGGLVKGGQVNLRAGDTIMADVGEGSFKDGDYIRVKSGSTIGWALKSNLGTWNAATKTYTLVNALTALLPGGSKKRAFSNTRKAIYNLREITKKSDGSNFLKSGGEGNWINYQIGEGEDDDHLLEILNKDLAPITSPT